MLKLTTAALAFSAALLSACTTQDATPPVPSLDRERLMSAAPEPEGPGTLLGPLTDISIVSAPGLPTHTLYYPVSNSADPLPVLIWGNGACTNAGRMFEKTLKKIASHGFAVIAVGPFEPTTDKTRTTGDQMLEAIDWLETSPVLPGSKSRTLNASKLAIMGQSCGGLMTLEIASDPRIDTIGIINSGTFPPGKQPMNMSGANKESLKHIHTPTVYLNGGPNDIAFENSNDDYSRIDGVPLFYGTMDGAGHLATHRHANGGRFAEVIVAWLEWQLKQDTAAQTWFVGAKCRLCTDPQWTIQRKGISADALP
ncbi:MAG: alpha/beta hydrolase [Hyphomonas sp.]